MTIAECKVKKNAIALTGSSFGNFQFSMAIGYFPTAYSTPSSLATFSYNPRP